MVSRESNLFMRNLLGNRCVTVYRLSSELGSGEFGVVRKGVWSVEREEREVAVKSLVAEHERLVCRPIHRCPPPRYWRLAKPCQLRMDNEPE